MSTDSESYSDLNHSISDHTNEHRTPRHGAHCAGKIKKSFQGVTSKARL